MTTAELALQAEQLEALLALMEEPRASGVSGDDCEWEHESDSEVCVTLTDVSLDCAESYLDDYYRSCAVEIEYRVSTDYDGDDYLDVEVECSADIGYRGRNTLTMRSDSDYDDEDHNLYSYGSDRGDITLDFSFSALQAVTSVRVDSAECEIDSVYSY